MVEVWLFQTKVSPKVGRLVTALGFQEPRHPFWSLYETTGHAYIIGRQGIQGYFKKAEKRTIHGSYHIQATLGSN